MNTNLLYELAAASAPVIVQDNTTIEVVKLILAALGPILAAATIYYTTKGLAAVKEAKKDIVDLKEHVNGKMGDLLKASERAAHAAGATEQRAVTAAVETAVLKSQVAVAPELHAEVKPATTVGALTDSEISKMLLELREELASRISKKV